MESLRYVTRQCSHKRALRNVLSDRAYITADILADYLDPDGFLECDINSLSHRTFPNQRQRVSLTEKALDELEQTGILAKKLTGKIVLIVAPALKSSRLEKSKHVERIANFRPDRVEEFESLSKRVTVQDARAVRALKTPKSKVLFLKSSSTFLHEDLSRVPSSRTIVQEEIYQPQQNQTLTEKNAQCIKSIRKNKDTEQGTANADYPTAFAEVKGLEGYEHFENRFENPELLAFVEKAFLSLGERYDSETLRRNARGYAETLVHVGRADQKLIAEVMVLTRDDEEKAAQKEGRRFNGFKYFNWVKKRIRDSGR